MNYKTLLTLLAVLVFMLAACTDANMGKLSALGNAANIKCYSGGTIIYDGKSTGKVLSEASSDGYFFKDAETGMFMEVSGNCVITYD